MTTYEQIEAAALALSPNERELLSIRLIDSNEPEVGDEMTDAEWDAELGRRIEAVESGREATVSQEEFNAHFARLMEGLSDEQRARAG